MIELGQEVRDKVTGFSGIASGKSEYLSGCTHICIQPKVKRGNKELPEPQWFDEPMVEVIGKAKIKKVTTNIGGPMLTKPSR